MNGLVIDGALDPALGWTLHAWLSIVMARAALAKLRDPGAFADTLDEYALLPRGTVRASAAAVVAIECLLVPALWIPSVASAACAAIAGMMLLYSVAISINLWRGRRDIDCGCSGPLARQPLHEWLVARNLAYLGLALVGSLPMTGRALGSLDVTTVCLATASLLAISLATDGLAAAAARTRLPGAAR